MMVSGQEVTSNDVRAVMVLGQKSTMMVSGQEVTFNPSEGKCNIAYNLEVLLGRGDP